MYKGESAEIPHDTSQNLLPPTQPTGRLRTPSFLGAVSEYNGRTGTLLPVEA
jgi:hypothetical protein